MEYATLLHLPSSWGISWQPMATVVVIPTIRSWLNAAPITKLSAKLWIQSLINITQPVGFTSKNKRNLCSETSDYEIVSSKTKQFVPFLRNQLKKHCSLFKSASCDYLKLFNVTNRNLLS